MKKTATKLIKLTTRIIILGWFTFLWGCAPAPVVPPVTEVPPSAPTATPGITPTPLPTRPPYEPGELVEYIAQTGDTLPALAARFNTSVDEILAANPIIPRDATTMPAGMPMQIPIYYMPLWGSPYQILPDSLFVNGPAQVSFDASAFVESQPGWFKDYREYAGGQWRTGAQVVDYVAQNFSVSPRLLLALLDYQSGALSQPEPSDENYPLGYRNAFYRGTYLQLIWAANTLNNGYYLWRMGKLLEFEHPDGRIERPDPWQNAGTVALHYYFSQLTDREDYERAIRSDGLQATYTRLFGDPWTNVQPHIPGSLQQPYLHLPFEDGKVWNYTGGPHTGWGKGEPYAGIDFAPSGVSGCNSSSEWVTSMTPGLVIRSGEGIVEVDMDGDGDMRTGWIIFYLHLATQDRAQPGTILETGTRVGHPSCEGGSSTGTHVHIARKYNGEWINAYGPLAFNLDGWVVYGGDIPYQGTLKRSSNTIIASDQAEGPSRIEAGE